MENNKQIKKEYIEPKFVVNKFCVDVLLVSGGSEDAFGSYNMGWFEVE